MSGKIKNCKPPFYVYILPTEKYIGVTTDIRKRMNKHHSYNNRYTADYKILKVFNVLSEALIYENKMQLRYNYPASNVRNQESKNNPYAKTVLHTLTGVYFDTIKEASKCFSYNYSAVRHAIKNENNKYNLIRL